MRRVFLSKMGVDFLLAPDGQSSRRVRKILAEKAPGLYRIAGPWVELMAQAHAAYLLPQVSSAWAEKLNARAALDKDAFWADSLAVAPLETVAELEAALNRLVEGAGPDADWPAFLQQLDQPSRCHRRLSQLHGLLEAMGTLPDAFQLMNALLKADHPPLRWLRVYRLEGLPELNAWQQAVLAKLAGDAPDPDDTFQHLLAGALEPPKTSKRALLAARSPYEPVDTPAALDDRLRVAAVRDRLEEVEVAAGMIQKAVGRGAAANSFGLLLPNDGYTLQAVETVFARCGLPLSGLERSIGQRDLGREVVRLMLLCLRRPAPIMAIAALLTSALMPWPLQAGQDYAQRVMDGDVLLKKRPLEPEALRLMGAVNEGADTPGQLQRHLRRLRGLLESGNNLYEHRQRAMACIDQLVAALGGKTELQWERLLSATNPAPIHTVEERAYWKEGVAVFHEGRQAWRTVDHLLVLGFNEGHYPCGAGASAVLTEAEWDRVASCGWPVITAEQERDRQRELFARQLACCTQQLTILFSRRDGAGKAMEPSSSLVFLARRFGIDPENLVLELDRRDDRKRFPELAMAQKKPGTPPRDLPMADIALKTDLLAAFGKKPGELAPLSPSAAETLMVSPFAWLLGRLGCEPRLWITDALDPMTAGTLAHGVFEALFPAGRPLIDTEDIRDRGPKILRQLTLQMAPFLRSPDWRVERLKLETEIVLAAERWRNLLASWKADVIGAEQWLTGRYNDIGLRGQSDLLLQVPSGKILVVDYKKSSSPKRRNRMRSRFDLQAHLYRLMIQTGGLDALGDTPQDIGVLYYLLNDQTALSDTAIASDGTAPGLEIIDSDISSQAMVYLDQRIEEIRAGLVRLNTTDDERWWDKNASIPIYVLDNSPLLRLFMQAKEAT